MSYRRCKDCRRPIYEPDQHELAELPPGWIAQGLCAACILEPVEPEEGVPDPLQAARLRSSGLPDALRGLSLGQLLQKEELKPAIDAARHWTISGGGLFLHGDVGRGKTYIAAAALNEAVAVRPIAWRSVPQLVFGIRADYGSSAHTEAQRIVGSTSGIVLDDLGQEAPTKAAGELLFAVIDERLAAGLPVLITSNLLPSQLGERYGAWLPSRLAQMNPIRVAGTDLRLEL
jgi:DNA replication protein DnaC